MYRIVLAAAVAAAALVPAAGSSAASPPCGKAVLAAWSKGTLRPTFPVHCYQEALTSLPADVAGYSTASDDIHLALLAALHRQRVPPGPSGPSAAVIVAVGGAAALAATLLGPIAIHVVRGLGGRRTARRGRST